MSRWNHAVCGECWFLLADKKDWGRPYAFDDNVRIPVRVLDAPPEPCCFCQRPTEAGIFVRHDPHLLECDHD